MRSPLAVLPLCAALTAGCNNSRPVPPSVPTPGTQRITGRERLGWDQAASSPSELAALRYAIYIDGTRSELQNASCDSTPGVSGYLCSAQLPTLTPGTHTIALASFIVDGTSVLEGVRSGDLQVLVEAGISVASSDGTAGSLNGLSFTTVDHVALHVDVVATGLERPTDLAWTRDGSAFVAEDAGRIRVLRDSQLQPDSTASVFEPASGQLLGIAVHEANEARHVFVVFTERSRSGEPTFSVARFREQHGRLVDRVVLLDSVPAAVNPRAAVRIGLDGKLYAAFDDGNVPRRSGDLAALNGKILRLNLDGTTPPDQDRFSPVYAYGFRAPAALTWRANAGEVWFADEAQSGEALMYVARPTRPRVRGDVTASFKLPDAAAATSMAFFSGRTIPQFESNLFVASAKTAQLLRLTFDRNDASRVVATERLVRGHAIRIVSQAPDGTLYLATETELARVTAAR